LVILSNLEFQSAKLIETKMGQSERLVSLNGEANREKDLFNRNNLKDLPAFSKKRRDWPNKKGTLADSLMSSYQYGSNIALPSLQII
jgi:hypothetical protein